MGNVIITPEKGTEDVRIETSEPVIYVHTGGSSGGSGSPAGTTGGISTEGMTGTAGETGTGTGSTGGWVEDEKGRAFVLSSGNKVSGSVTINADGTTTEKITWLNVDGNFYSVGSDGYVDDGWVKDTSTDKWYSCDKEGGLETGWLHDAQDKHWYYLDPRNGQMLTGWYLVDDKWYYYSDLPDAGTWYYDPAADKWLYNTASKTYPLGALYMNTMTPDGYIVDADGVWTK